MGTKINDLLEEEIRTQIQALSSLATGSKEKSEAVDDLVKLYKLRIEEAKNDSDTQEKREKRIMDNEQHQLDTSIKERQIAGEVDIRDRDEQFKREQLSEQVKDRYFRLGLDVAGIILPLIFYATWMRRGFRFEETGTYTSTTFRGLFNRFKPTKN